MQDYSFGKLCAGEAAITNSGNFISPGKETHGHMAPTRGRKQDQLDEKNLRNRVLLVGRVRELALYRAEVLRHAGFQVRIPESREEAAALIERGDFDVAVLSYTLSNDTVQQLADQIRERCPRCPVVAIAETNRIDRRIAPDAVALAAEGPPALISALHKVLKQS